MYDYVRPDKVLTALEWLQLHNPLYKDIAVNTNWVEQAVSDDETLWKALTQQGDPDAGTAHVSKESDVSTSLTSRFSTLQTISK